MRIAVAVHGYPPGGRGGVEQVAREQASALLARGHEVFVFAREVVDGSAEGTVTDEHVDGVMVRRVGVREGARDSFADYYDGRHLDAAFAEFLSEVSPDVLHVQHLVTLSGRLVALARQSGIPCVLSLHDAWYLCHRLFLLDAEGKRCPGPDAGLRCVPCLAEHGVGEQVRQRFESMAVLLSGIDALTAPSPSLRDRYVEQYPFLAGRIRIVEPGLAWVPRVAPPRPASRLRILFAGTLMPHKGLDLLLEAVDELPAADFELQIYGEEDGAGADWLTGLRDRTTERPIAWKGHYEPARVDDVLAGIDVLVVPSRCDESWSRVVREARAAGRIVVATNSGGPADWLTHEHDALLFEPDSATGLRDALARLLEDDGLRARLSSPAQCIPTVEEAAVALEATFLEAIEAVRGAAQRAAPPRVTVAYVTRDGEAWIGESVRSVQSQRGEFELVEILAVDSGSRDATVEILRQNGVRVLQIPPGEFGHGRTRNLVAREARGEIVAFLTQDATPDGPDWLARLVAKLEQDPLCVAAWSRHLPREDCHPMECRMLAEHPAFAPGLDAVQSARGNPDWARDPDAWCSLSNNAAAYRCPVLLDHPFPEVRFAEDRAWARERLLEGWRTVLVGDSLVRHSHAYSPWVHLRRNFDHFRSLHEDFDFKDNFGFLDGLRAAWREMRRDVDFEADRRGAGRGVTLLRWGPQALLYHMGAFAGRWLGSHVEWMPRGLPDRLALHVADGSRREHR